MVGEESAGERRLRERKVTRSAGQARVAGGMREGAAIEQRTVRAWEIELADTESQICLICQAIEQSVDAAGLALESLASLVETECAWCGDWWPVSEVHDVAEIFSGSVVLVCPFCDPN